MYLYRISLQEKMRHSFSKPVKPIYVVAKNNDAARELANKKIRKHLEIKKVLRLAEQLAPHIFSGAINARIS